jgi:hypothetical protein
MVNGLAAALRTQLLAVGRGSSDECPRIADPGGGPQNFPQFEFLDIESLLKVNTLR